jgi:transposase
MNKHFRDYQPNQMFLLPLSLNDWLPKDHLVYFISDTVDHLDLSEIYDSYTELRGYPPYAPVMMVKVLLYAFSVGIRSSRKIERKLLEDIAFRLLSANQQPDYWTINEFRNRHLDALGKLFVQTVKLASEAGLVKLGHVAIDGTKIKANASKHSAMSYARMNEEEKRLKAIIDQYFREADAIDKEEDRLYGNKRGDELPEHLNTEAKRLKAIRAAKKALEEEAKKKAEDEAAEKKKKAEKDGKTYKPQKDPQSSKPKPKAQRNFTDPDSRIMLSSDKAFIQAYNCQAAVDAESQIIVAADITNQAADSPHLMSMVNKIVETTGLMPTELSADAGYWNEENIEELMRKHIGVFIPPEKIRHSEWKQATALKGRIPDNITLKDRMRRKLRTKRGKERYGLRMTSVEPVFGQIKECRNLRQFLLRGLEKIRSLWNLECAVHNLLKIFRAQAIAQPA